MPDNERLDMIECPYCGAQYLPVEIYIPDVFFGKPKHIEKTTQGKIIDVLGSCTNTEEHFECEYCNKPFRIKTRLQFSVKPEDRFNFDEEYSTKLKKNVLFMNED